MPNNLVIETQKKQLHRLYSIFIVSPLIIWIATMEQTPMWARVFLVVAGLALMASVGYHYLETKKDTPKA